MIKPNEKNIFIEKITEIDFKDNKFHIFYPANNAAYKNHELIINALKYTKDNEAETYKKLIVHFALDRNLSNDRNAELIGLAEKLLVIEHIRFTGKKKKKQG